MVSKPAFYLDEGLTISGSGFAKFEPIMVSIDLGDGTEPNLGFIDANRGGAWALSLPAVGEAGGVSRWASALVEAGVVTVRADGADGSTASIPVNVLGVTTPAAPEPPPDSGVATSLTAGTVEVDGELELIGAGYAPGERVFFVAIVGVGTGLRGGIATPGAGDPLRKPVTQGTASDTGVVSAIFKARADGALGIGSYTIEGIGEFGSIATAAVIIVEPK